MNVSRTFVAVATAVSLLAAIGCTSTQRPREVATAPMAVPAPAPEPVVVVADAMPSHPALQNERTPEVAVSNPAPVMAASEPPVNTTIADFAERPPQADRN